jgi:hypothetical protein
MLLNRHHRLSHHMTAAEAVCKMFLMLIYNLNIKIQANELAKKQHPVFGVEIIG